VSTSAIIVAHPGHELRVFHWMERTRPAYCCLTEGSGGSASSRMPSTDTVLARVGSRPGPLYGRYADKEIYRFLLEGRVEVFVDLAEELADVLVSAGVDAVAGDAVEGFNPTHDVCRFVIDGAVELARRRTGRAIDNRDFVLEGRPDVCPEASRSAATWLQLDDAALDRKIDAALQYPELRPEVHAAIERFGRAAFAVECLRPVTTALMLEAFEQELPAYERYGEQRVSEGRYTDIIRYRRHVLPVRAAIEAACQGRTVDAVR
jgi:hypothetical protein